MSKSGLLFEQKINLEKIEKIDYLYLKKKKFNNLMNLKYHIPKENLYREPDAVFINEKLKIIYIIEIKFQKVEGSVDTKLWASVAIRDIYIKNLTGFIIRYSLCVNNYFKNKFIQEKKFIDLNEYLEQNNIKIFYGDDENCLDKIKEWISIIY